jgi:hypothetical protein
MQKSLLRTTKHKGPTGALSGRSLCALGLGEAGRVLSTSKPHREGPAIRYPHNGPKRLDTNKQLLVFEAGSGFTAAVCCGHLFLHCRRWHHAATAGLLPLLLLLLQAAPPPLVTQAWVGPLHHLLAHTQQQCPTCTHTQQQQCDMIINRLVIASAMQSSYAFSRAVNAVSATTSAGVQMTDANSSAELCHKKR